MHFSLSLSGTASALGTLAEIFMKLNLRFILLILFANKSFGQIPNFTNHSTKQDTLKSEIFKTFSNSYEFTASLEIDNYSQSDQKHFLILAYRKGKWYIIHYDLVYKMGTGLSKLSIISEKLRKKTIRKRKVKQLFAKFESQRIWTLDMDSANIISRKLNDSLSIFLAVNDGISYKFEFISATTYRVLFIDNPEAYFESFPEYQLRANLIYCIEEFCKITK